jgi:hypothetical protein
MADYDVLDMAVMLRDAQRSLRKLFPDYETKAEPCRQLLRRMMADIPTDKVLVALTYALQAVVDANGGEYCDTQKIQVHSLWLTAAAKDLLDEEHSASVADKIKELLK